MMTKYEMEDDLDGWMNSKLFGPREESDEP